MDSNYTLRFHRTGREAFGHECRFEERHDPDRMVGLAMALLFAFVAGLFVGGVL